MAPPPMPERWTLPAFARYEAEVGPAEAADLDQVIAIDTARHDAHVALGAEGGQMGTRMVSSAESAPTPTMRSMKMRLPLMSV